MALQRCCSFQVSAAASGVLEAVSLAISQPLTQTFHAATPPPPRPRSCRLQRAHRREVAHLRRRCRRPHGAGGPGDHRG
eukprot:1325385-Alexandrium_andersonii.AAC.1